VTIFVVLSEPHLDGVLQTLAQFSPKHLDQTHLQTDSSNQQPESPVAMPRSGSPLKQEATSYSNDEEASLPDRSTSLRAKHHTVRYENAQVTAQGKAKLNEEDIPPTPGWSEKPSAKPAERTTSALRKKQYRNTFKLEGCVFILCSVVEGTFYLVNH
jgi:hypothetical protein